MIGAASFIVALSTLAFSLVRMRGVAKQDYVKVLEQRIVLLEFKIEECSKDKSRLEKENHSLLIEILAYSQKYGKQ